jgi:eukaryotic-like serine/threonine-protein kinase
VSALLELEAGRVFAGKYRVVRLVKTGGMGAVYEVRHTANDKRWALKIIKPELARDPEARTRFEREAKIDGLIGSAFVASVIDAGIDEPTGMPYLVMEFLVGEELGVRVARLGALPSADVVRYMGQVARALDKAHDKKVVHRDLKPENLFLCTSEEEEPKVKVLDFGIAKLLEGALDVSTHGGGTPLYMAPEQTRRGREIGPWTDIWALGLVAYTLLVGRHYWEGTTLVELVGELTGDAPREAPSVRAARRGVVLPSAFDTWFFRCVHNDPKERFARAGEAAASLAGALAESGPSPLAETFAPPAPKAAAPAAAPATPAARTPPFALDATEPMPEARTTGPLSSTARPAETPARARTIPRTATIAIVTLLGAVALVLWQRSSAVPPAATVPSSSPTTAPLEDDLRSVIARENPFLRAGAIALQRTEVTRGQYARFVASLTSADRSKARPLREWAGESIDERLAHRPVTWVTWGRAVRFCAAVDARLPTPAEWKAAATANGEYPWGAAWPPPMRAVVADAHGERTPADVGAWPLDTTRSGHADLFGNVAEWTAPSTAGLAYVLGAPRDVGIDDARTMFIDGVQKVTAEGTTPEDDAEELADPLTGFRCARAP